MPDVNDRIRQFLATEPGSLGLSEKLAKLEAENDRLETELAKTKHNRDTILAEKKILEGKPDKVLRGTATELHIDTADAIDPQKYRAMKELAARQGRTLRIVNNTVPSGIEKRSPVKYVEDRDAGVLYTNAAVRDRVGIARLQEIARERGLPNFKTFRYPHELPRHLHQQHAQTMADSAVDTLVEVDRD